MRRVDYADAMDVLRRGRVLSTCLDDPRSRREIAEAADLSRTTAYRATTELTEAGLLAPADGGYETTAGGATVLQAADRFREAVGTADRLEPLFEVVDHPELIQNAHRLGDAEVIVADAENPYRVVERSVERLAETDRSRGTLANPVAVESIRQSESLVPETEQFERILTEAAFETNAAIGREAFEAATSGESIELLIAPAEAIPFSFAIDDDDVSVVGHDPQTGIPTVHVESTAPAAREWLEGVYERCLADAEPV